MNPKKKVHYSGIKEIARLAGVSIGTVDRVLHHREGVSDETRKKVLAIIADLNYEPNLLASALATKKSRRIAVLIPSHTRGNSYWQAPLEGIERAEKEISAYGVHLVKEYFDQYDPESFVGKADLILASQPDGILFAPIFSRESLHIIEACDKNKIPYVFIDTLIPGQNNLSYFGQNAFQSGKLGAKLLDYGVPDKAAILIVHLADMANYNHLQQRELGFRSYFEDKADSNRKLYTIEIPGILEVELRVVVQGQLRKIPDIKGIFVTSNVQRVARIVDQYEFEKPKLIGYDLTPENLVYLKKGVIDILIWQRPEEQGYGGILCLFNFLQTGKPEQKLHYSSMDIITRENIPNPYADES